MNPIMLVTACATGPALVPPEGADAGRMVIPVVTEEWAPDAPTGEHLAEELFDDGFLPAFDLELSETALDALRVRPEEWVEGAMVYRGVRFEPVGVRIKGNNSFLPVDEKPSLKIALDRVLPDLTLLGLHELTLDNMSTDPSMMHERLAYRLFREAGLPASRANHATVRINGEDRGLYTLVENVDQDLLALRYPDPRGSLWELSDVEFLPLYADWFEHEAGSPDRNPIRAIAAAMAGPDPFADASPWVDWAQFVDFTAACAVVGQFDSYPWRSPGDDVHLYFDPADGKMDTLPHGMDETFSRSSRDVMDAEGLLFQACQADPGCARDYVDSVWDVQAAAEAFDLEGYARQVRDRIQPLVEADPRRPYSRNEVEDAQDEVLRFVGGRRDELVRQLGRP